MSLITRFLVCALIVASVSVFAAFAWDQSDANTVQAATGAPAEAKLAAPPSPGSGH